MEPHIVGQQNANTKPKRQQKGKPLQRTREKLISSGKGVTMMCTHT